MISFVFAIVLLLSSATFIQKLFFHDYDYLHASLLANQKIADYVSEKNEVNEFVITNRYGPTQYNIPAYIGSSFDNYWDNYDQQEMVYNSLTFAQIDFALDKPEKDKYYIGFPREFIGDQDSYEEEILPSYYELVEVMQIPDELVYKFGKDLWVVKPR
jgi:hypothetical protein